MPLGLNPTVFCYGRGARAAGGRSAGGGAGLETSTVLGTPPWAAANRYACGAARSPAVPPFVRARIRKSRPGRCGGVGPLWVPAVPLRKPLTCCGCALHLTAPFPSARASSTSRPRPLNRPPCGSCRRPATPSTFRCARLLPARDVVGQRSPSPAVCRTAGPSAERGDREQPCVRCATHVRARRGIRPAAAAATGDDGCAKADARVRAARRDCVQPRGANREPNAAPT